MLDTNILSDAMRNPRGVIRQRIEEVGPDSVYTSIIVAAELRFGVAKSGSSRLASNFDEVIRPLEVVPFAAPADRIYADLRADLDRCGTPIGANDLWIAAQALHDGSVLVTDNMSEFSRVPGLTVENWLRP
nr:type II toxin-antitoxin system VapC family toxin [Enterovirga sp. DB1703]